MKTIFKIAVCILCYGIIASCSSEEFTEDIKEEVVDPDTTDPDTTDPDTEIVISTTPCDFDLSDVVANSTVKINCLLDLKGETRKLPENVTLLFDGGDIVNGTLEFGNGSLIDGELMDSSLILKNDVKLTKPEFNFIPSRWGIVEGKTTKTNASKNHETIQCLVEVTKEMGAEVFNIDQLDAYFLGSGTFHYNIVLPSDFHLKMSDNTHLRTFPTDDDRYSTFLIIIQDVKNVKVTGGHLHGDRDLYDRKDKLPLSHTMKIKTGNNIVIDGVHMSNATQDGLAIENERFTFDPDYIGSNNIMIKNCTFDSNRRINLTITDGKNITIENCEFIDGGVPTSKSNARAPSCNLNIEPHRTWDDSGNLKEYQRVSHVYIKNNKQIVRDPEKNSKAGSFLISHGNGPIIIENNEMVGCGVSFHTVDGVIIRNNNILNGSINAGSPETFGRSDFVFGNEVYNNTVKTTKTALNIAGNGITIKNNILEGTVGVAIGAGAKDKEKGASNIKFFDNKVTASSRGLRTLNTLQDVTIENNTLKMLKGANWSFALSNKWSKSADANFIVTNNSVTGEESESESGAPATLISASSISFTDNKVGNIQISGGNDISVRDNEVDANIGEHGILFYDDAPNSEFIGNDIITYPSETPLKIECIKIAKDVSLSGTVEIDNNDCEKL